QVVGFAHRNLVVHRDLKPSNILVTAEGEPKLLDFGISKLLDAEQKDDKTAITILGAMTPEYASPEQIKGEQITTAADIYSLGVILFKILTDNFPYNFKDKTNGNLLKEITDSAPMRPSAAVNFAFDKAHAKSRIPNPKSLSGDLDNIILKSLSKEPERRYKTVEQFSADIWRFIDGLPVLARPATFAYRANKFFKRNKISVIAAVLIFLSLITGIIAAFRQTKIAEQQANIAVESRFAAERETVKAKAEQEKSEKISKFMAKIISYANPAWYAEGSKFGGNARVIDVLDDLGEKIDAEFEGQADVQAELHHKFAEVYGRVAYKNMEQTQIVELTRKYNFHALRALELRKQFYGERHELVAKDLFYAHHILRDDDRGQAELLAEAIQMMRETNPNNLNLPYMLEDYSSRLALPDTPQTHETYRQSVIPPTDENKYQIAERYLREALPIFRFHYKEDNYAIFGNECHLAYILAMQEKWTDFDDHYAVCKQGEEKLKDGDVAAGMRKNVELVEKVLAEKNGK
ncbi:MAG: protein kinase, partial [Acidobacteriota bacterium]|nr:protein kinase [Acidobacteriota bacterium]